MDEPAAPIRHVWRRGDTLSALAARHGLAHWTRIWNDDANSDLRRQRGTPDQIRPGDIVMIPRPREGEDSGATEAEHRFQAIGVPPAAVRFVDDMGQTTDQNATVIDNLQVSWFVTTRDLPTDWWRRSTDRRNFRIEVTDLGEQGRSIPRTRCRLEVLKPRLNAQGRPVLDVHNDIIYESFATPRRLDVELQLVPNSNPRIYRSRYLRLVTDGADRSSRTDQTLLADHDPQDLRVEILDQAVRVTYTSSRNEPLSAFATIGRDKQRFRMTVNILRRQPNGTAVGGLTRQDVHRSIRCWVRRTYAQGNMAPDLVEFGELPEGCPNGAVAPRSNTNPRQTDSLSTDAPGVRIVDPPRNMAVFFNYRQAAARGNGELSFRVRVDGESDRTYTRRPDPGEEPLVTAQRFGAQLTNAGFIVEAASNSRAWNRARSADLVVWDRNRRRVTIDRCRSADARQMITAARVDPQNFPVLFTNSLNWLNVTPGAMRCLCRNYRGRTTNRIDVFVVETLAGGNLGRAAIEHQRLDADYRGIDPIKNTCYIKASTLARRDREVHTTDHECGHILIDMHHIPGHATELMTDLGENGPNRVNSSKRLSDRDFSYREHQAGRTRQDGTRPVRERRWVTINQYRGSRSNQQTLIGPWGLPSQWPRYDVMPAP
jgi:hypothetical protein